MFSMMLSVPQQEPIASIVSHPMAPSSLHLQGDEVPTVNKDGNTAIDKTKLKSKLCNRWLAGSMCRFGDRCAFAHGEVELRRPGMVTVGAPSLLSTLQGVQQDLSGVVMTTGEYDMSTSIGEYDCESELYGTPLTTTLATPLETPLTCHTSFSFPPAMSGTWRNDPYGMMTSRVPVHSSSESASDEGSDISSQ